MRHRKLAGCTASVTLLLMAATGSVFAAQGNAAEMAALAGHPVILEIVREEIVSDYDRGKDALRNILNQVETEAMPRDLRLILQILDPEVNAAQKNAGDLAGSQQSAAGQLLQELNTGRSRDEKSNAVRMADVRG